MNKYIIIIDQTELENVILGIVKICFEGGITAYYWHITGTYGSKISIEMVGYLCKFDYLW